MRTFSFVLTLAFAGMAALAPLAAHAQATVDERALEPLQTLPTPPAEPAKPPGPAHAHPSHRAPSHPSAPHAGTPPASPPATASQPAPGPNVAAHPVPPAAKPPTPPAPPQIRVPLAAPPAPVLPPALVVPTRPPAPPSPAPVAADAPGAAAQIQDGLRVTFGEARADLNPGTESALRTLAHAAAAETAFTVSAFAPGTPEDPSSPRRLSLSRALTVRSVLIAEGISSVRIYVRALGASHGVEDGPPDRVDVTLAAPNAQARSPQ